MSYRRSITLKLALCLLVILFVFVGCEDHGNGGGTLTKDIIIPDTTKVLDDTTIQHLSFVSNDHSTLIFDGSTPLLQSLAPGDVIVSGVNAFFPFGVLRKVTAVTQNGNQVTIETTQATLEDAVEKGLLRVKNRLTINDSMSGSARRYYGTIISAPATSAVPQVSGSDW